MTVITSTPLEYDVDLKLVLVGDPNVGKSRLLSSFTPKTFKVLPPTHGADKKLLYSTNEGKRVRLSIWDTAGQERYRSVTRSYYRDVNGFILVQPLTRPSFGSVYDVTVRSTFTNLNDYWINEINKHSTNKNNIKVIVGNKADEEMKRIVTRNEGNKLAQENGCLFFECSAMNQTNVEKCLNQLESKILETAAEADSWSQLCTYGFRVNNGNQSPPKSNEKCC